MVSGHKVYVAYFPNPPSLPTGSAPSGYGYRNNKTNGMPTKSADQRDYMIAINGAARLFQVTAIVTAHLVG